MPRPRHATRRRSPRVRLGRGASWLLAAGLVAVTIAGPSLTANAGGQTSSRQIGAPTATAQPGSSGQGTDVTFFALLGMISLTALLVVTVSLPDRARRSRDFQQAEASKDRDDETRGATRTAQMSVAVKVALFMTLVIAYRVVIGIRGVRR